LDVNAERLSNNEAADRVLASNPRLVVFVVYGQNVNAGTVSMSGAVKLSTLLKEKNPSILISYIGSYVQALPRKALIDEPSIDFLFTNEGVFSLLQILSHKNISAEVIRETTGICFRDEDGKPTLTEPGQIVPSEKLDLVLPGYAWDLLPFKNRPLDLYRSPLWHAEYRDEYRTPYAAIQTSLGCNFGCSFCMINILNRSDNEEIGVASSYKGMRFWSTDFILRQIDILNELGVRTIRIVDEMFLLYKKHYLPLCESLAKRDYAKDLRMWSYSRVDTVTNPEFLRVVRSAGIRWLCLGIESANRNVRLEVSKGKFQDVDIRKVVDQVHEAGIEVMANYMVGLPGDTSETMRATLELSKELCTSGWNMYAAMALPGSELYKKAIDEGKVLPQTYSGYSFHSRDTLPLGTVNVTPSEALKFRDEAFLDYHLNPNFLTRIERNFGENAVLAIRSICDTKLVRDIYS
jgi:radical SAM superfamily enzyme YgiQ (UPF0313 family)